MSLAEVAGGCPSARAGESMRDEKKTETNPPRNAQLPKNSAESMDFMIGSFESRKWCKTGLLKLVGCPRHRTGSLSRSRNLNGWSPRHSGKTTHHQMNCRMPDHIINKRIAFCLARVF